MYIPILFVVAVKLTHESSTNSGRAPYMFLLLQLPSSDAKLAIQPQVKRFSRSSLALGRDRAVLLKASMIKDFDNIVNRLRWIVDVS